MLQCCNNRSHVDVIATIPPHVTSLNGDEAGRWGWAQTEDKTMNANVQPSNAELMAIIKRLQDENAALRNSSAAKLTLKVSEKGAVCLYGMGKWPVTLYANQWLKVLDMAEQIKGFIKANKALLSVKEGEAINIAD
jgi:hypothetical protein